MSSLEVLTVGLPSTRTSAYRVLFLLLTLMHQFRNAELDKEGISIDNMHWRCITCIAISKSGEAIITGMMMILIVKT